ncbi:Fibrinogen C domain-containing protein 1 [Mactra antiquata]
MIVIHMYAILLIPAMTSHLTSAANSWVCSASSDTFLTASNNEGDDKSTLKRLNTQVKQLQRLLENKTPVYSTINGIPRDCEEIYANGTVSDGVYAISPDGRCPFFVFCDMTNGGWTLIQRRVDGEVNFVRPWMDYVMGFGDKHADHWLGLEKIHRLSRDGSEIYFDIENYDGTKEYAHYKVFTVHGGVTKYKMNVDSFGYNGSVKELFSYHDNMMFSTYDRDNDVHATLNCADNHGGGGWWFRNCHRFGAFNAAYGRQTGRGISYHDNGYYFIKRIVIKLKAVQGQCESIELKED